MAALNLPIDEDATDRQPRSIRGTFVQRTPRGRGRVALAKAPTAEATG